MDFSVVMNRHPAGRESPASGKKGPILKMKMSCRYITDHPRDYRIAVSNGISEYILRVLGHPAEVNPEVEFVGDYTFYSHDFKNNLITETLAFHFDIYSDHSEGS